jgi:hypothetical protein
MCRTLDSIYESEREAEGIHTQQFLFWARSVVYGFNAPATIEKYLASGTKIG